jgi:four helix bundle protein
MVNDFSDLKVWQASKKVLINIYSLTKTFPKQENYGLTDQLRRAANSICANIAEGFDRYHPKDKIRFYYNARGSASEVKSHIMISKELNYISAETSETLITELNLIGKMLNGMISSLCERNRP